MGYGSDIVRAMMEVSGEIAQAVAKSLRQPSTSAWLAKKSKRGKQILSDLDAMLLGGAA